MPLLLKNASGSDPSVAPPSTMIVASTMDIQDDIELKRNSIVQFSPSITPDTCLFQSECSKYSSEYVDASIFNSSSLTAQLSSLQLLACDVNFYEDKRDVVPQIGLTGESTTAPRKSGWSDWTLPAAPRYSALSLVSIHVAMMKHEILTCRHV